MNSYLFYDLETTGLNTAFDQILQFAAIRTDMTFKEVDRYSINLLLRPDIIPSPLAFLTHGIDATDPETRVCEFEGISEIHRIINTPGTINIGYNSLNFDDEFLRFSFYRNLLPPYTHQYDRGCSRMDLLPIVIMFRLYRPEVLNWPTLNGKLSLKLEQINLANRLAEGPAHDAMCDAEATWALARRLVSEKKMWDYISGYFHKTTDVLRADSIPAAFETPDGAHRKALMVAGELGRKLMYQAPVLSMENSVPYANQSLWLRLDLPELRKTSADNIDDTTWVIRKKMGEPGILLPPLPRYWEKLGIERRTLARQNIKWLQSHPDVFSDIIRFHREYRYPPIPDLDADAALYEIVFFSRNDLRLFRQFHEGTIEERVRAIHRFPKETLRELASRILLRNYHSQLPENYSLYFSNLMEKVNPQTEDMAMVDFRGKHRATPRSALDEIKGLVSSAPADQIQSLETLREYIETHFQKDPTG